MCRKGKYVIWDLICLAFFLCCICMYSFILCCICLLFDHNKPLPFWTNSVGKMDQIILILSHKIVWHFMQTLRRNKKIFSDCLIMAVGQFCKWISHKGELSLMYIGVFFPCSGSPYTWNIQLKRLVHSSCITCLWNMFASRKLTIMKTRLFKYIENFTSKHIKFSDKKICFSYFCSKHRLWILIRTASARQF